MKKSCVCVFSLLILFLSFTIEAKNLDDWLNVQEKISLSKIQENISPEDAKPGVVIASPSTQKPDYYYHWVRDAALAMDVFNYTSASKDLLLEFATFSRQNQIDSGFLGLGEPKYYVHGLPYDLPWGRPQNDGPALRALTLIRFANTLLEQGDSETVRKYLYAGAFPATKVIKVDLEFTGNYWSQPCFDLWEERWGHHFYTRMVQRRALLEGSRLAEKLDDPEAATWYFKEASKIEKDLLRFQSIDKEVLLPTLNGENGNDFRETKLDTSILLAVLHSYNFQDRFYSASNEWILSTTSQLEAAFEKTYPINDRAVPGILIGRYPEDEYYGGNPWFLTTLAMAEIYYRAILEFIQDEKIEITALNQKFFNRLIQRYGDQTKLKIGETFTFQEDKFHEILNLMRWKADNFLRVIQLYTKPSGAMSEQISKQDGRQISANDLTWSYAAFLTAKWLREEVLAYF